MAFTLGSNAQAVESGTQCNIASTSFSSGNGLVAMVTWRVDTAALSSITYDPGGANSTALSPVGTQVLQDSTEAHHIYYLGNIPVTASKVVRAVFAADLAGGGVMTVYEIVGGDSSALLDSSGSATGSATGTSASCTFTTNTANCCIFAIGSDNSAELTVGAGYTLFTVPNVSNFDNGEYNLDVGAAGSKSPAFVVGSSDAWSIKAAAFKLGAPVTPYIIGNLNRWSEREWRPAPFRPGIAR